MALTKGLIEDFDVPCPPLATQRSISRMLTLLDDKIDLNRRTNRTLESLARAIFQSWFVNFDPVVAKADGRQPFGMDEETAALFPDRFVELELGPTPEGWEIAALPQRIEVNPKRKLRKGDPAPYLEMANMPERSAIPEAWRWREYGSGMRSVNGDTLVARITPCLENERVRSSIFCRRTRWVGVRPSTLFCDRSTRYRMNFAYFLAQTDDFRGFAMAELTGSSGRQRVPTRAWQHYEFPFPPDSVACKFGTVTARSCAN